MMKRIFLFLLVIMGLIACQDDDSFSASPSLRLTFSVDTVRLDTVFSTIGSSTYTMWVFNHSGDGLHIKSVRLRQGNQTGFRVNVDGVYLDNAQGSIATELEVRKGDSIRVFVELTPHETHQPQPVDVSDDLVFSLESGVEQSVPLHAFAWDALVWHDKVIRKDTIINSSQPIIIYGGLRVDSSATLAINNTTLYFHDQAGMDVYGTVHAYDVTLRGDRLDRMFDYLPYDHVSGQWRGLRFMSSSTNNVLMNTEIRNAMQGVVCDSAVVDSLQPRLTMFKCVIHNCKGVGLQAFNSFVMLDSCQITNTLSDCMAFYGGLVVVEHSTVAQFYPFNADRGVALRFANSWNGHPYPLALLWCRYSIFTGYEDDVVMGDQIDTAAAFGYYFDHCLMRTPEIDDTVNFERVIWETPKDSVQGKQHFVLIDEENLLYDFHLDSLSTAKGLGCY